MGSRGVHGHQEEDQDHALGHVILHAQVLDRSIRRRNLEVAAREREIWRDDQEVVGECGRLVVCMALFIVS